MEDCCERTHCEKGPKKGGGGVKEMDRMGEYVFQSNIIRLGKTIQKKKKKTTPNTKTTFFYFRISGNYLFPYI